MTANNPSASRAEQAGIVEKMIVDAIPEIVGKLIAMARDGSVPAARYLVDRVCGRPAKAEPHELGKVQKNTADLARTTLDELASLCFPDNQRPAQIDLSLGLKSKPGIGLGNRSGRRLAVGS